MSIRPSLLGALIVGLADLGAAIPIRDYPASVSVEPIFTGHRSPRRTRNGGAASGAASGAAAAKRAKRRRRNIAKHPRGAA